MRWNRLCLSKVRRRARMPAFSVINGPGDVSTRMWVLDSN